MVIVGILFANVSVAQDSAPPNIVIIFADDLGIGDLGSYGNTRIKTPHLDRMAAEGARLTSFFASASVCTPSRGGLLMGQYPVRNQLTADVARPSNKIGIPDNAITIADSLNELGYATACIGKWHLGHRPNQWPTEHGFDYFYGVPWSNDMTPFNLYRQSEEIESPVDQTTITERYTQEAITFIEAHQNEPFFVYLPHSMPHVPLFVSEKFAHKSDAGLYGDVIEAVDWSVGEIMKTLERLNIDDNTLVIFTSDNG
ncbi:MAG: sulfatase-like hydrolase/transferase, partial [Candidatus Hydrogenedentota bacterium]